SPRSASRAEHIARTRGHAGYPPAADTGRASMDRVMKPPPPVDGPALPDAAAERTAAQVDAPAVREVPTAAVPDRVLRRSWRDRFGHPPPGPLLMGLAASLLMVIGGFGAGGVLVHDPVLSNSPLGFWRYGHGRDLASMLVYGGVGLMTWA